MTWTSEKEQRQATAHKAQDAYSVARQAMERCSALEEKHRDLEAQIEELHRIIGALRAEIRRKVVA